MKKTLTLIAAMMLVCIGVKAQIVTSSPYPLQESSKDVVITYNAASPLGNNGLANLSDNFDVYVHIGVITNLSANWSYVVTPWPETGNSQEANTDKNRLTRVDKNTYTLNIGDIRTYFGITNPNEHVKRIAMVFRNVDGKKQGKTKDGGDIFLDVLEDGFAMELTSDHPNRVINKPTEINFTVATTAAADLTLKVDGVAFATEKAATSLSASYTFEQTGLYSVAAVALYEGKEYTQTLTVNYPAGSSAQDYPGGVPRQGAVKNADGTVTFCLAAPGKNGVVLVGSWDNYEILDKNLMKYQDYEGNRYFWTTVSGLADDVWYSYYYIVDDLYKVADPYAHLVLDCYNDRTLRNSSWPSRPKYPTQLNGQNIMLAVYRGDIDDYTFSPFEIPEHDNLVVYELLLRDFTGINGQAQGWGTVNKAIEKIPYIKEMGFNAIELLPIMEYNGNNSWGYNTNFYMAPDKNYGSPTDYKDFIEECHKQGIAVILDIVFNQSDGLHPWYQMYPIDSNPFYNKTAPHGYSVLNDWNQDNELVQQQWTDAIKYWMEKYNVDGFRFDLVKGLGDNNSYKNGTDGFNQSRVDRMKRLHDVIKSVKPNGIHINENLAGAQEEKLMGEDGEIQWANINDASCQYAMGWDDGNNNLFRFLSTSDGSRPWGSTISYAESHDEQRMAYKSITWGQDIVKNDDVVRFRRLGALAVQMLLTPGPKMVWMFGELGDSQNAKDANGGNNTSPKIVDWNWLDDPQRHYLMETYGAMIRLRMENPELFTVDTKLTRTGMGSKYTTARVLSLSAGDKEIVAMINPNVSGSDIVISATSTVMTPSNGSVYWSSYGFEPVLEGEGNKLTCSVPANGWVVFVTENLSGIEDLPGVSGGANVAVRGGYGEVIVEGNYNSMSVYDLAGRVCDNHSLLPGIYIAVVDGKSHKVLVR